MRDVVNKDFAVTLDLLMREHTPNFDPNILNDFLNSFVWLDNEENYISFEKADKTGDFSKLPRALNEFRSSLKLYIKLTDAIKKLDRRGASEFLDQTVAYSPNLKDELLRDLKVATNDRAQEIQDDPKFDDPDDFCAELLHEYWRKLWRRAVLKRVVNANEKV